MLALRRPVLSPHSLLLKQSVRWHGYQHDHQHDHHHGDDCGCGAHTQQGFAPFDANSGNSKQHSSHSHSFFGGHSHSHGTENAELLMKRGGLSDPRVRITWLGLLANIGMAVGKGIGGVVFHSQSLVADAMHAVTDMVSDLLTLSTVSVARQAPTRRFPNGFGRIEAIGAFGVSSLLLAAGASMGWGSLVTVLESFGHLPDWMHAMGGHIHTHGEVADWNAAYIALASIVIKESLFQATYRVGIRTNSQVLVANAWHHRIDCLASAVAVLSIAGGQLFGLAWLDPLGGMLVSGMIVRAGWQPTKDSALELAGCAVRALDSATLEEVRRRAEITLRSIAPEYRVVDVILEPYGSTFVATIQVAGVEKGAEYVAKVLRHEILDIQHLRECRVTIA